MSADAIRLPPDLLQARFVSAFLELGGRPADAPAAAIRAGCVVDEKEATRAAAILLGAPAVADAIKQQVAQNFRSCAGAALATIIDLCQNAPPSIRLAAAKELLDRGIGPVPSKSAVLHASTSIEDLLLELDANLPGEIKAQGRTLIDDAEQNQCFGAVTEAMETGEA